jgi:hypothetical protein
MQVEQIHVRYNVSMNLKIIHKLQRTVDLLRFKIQQMKMLEEPDTPIHMYLTDIETHLDQTELDLAGINDRILASRRRTANKL